MGALRKVIKGHLGNREFDPVLAMAGRERTLVRSVVSLLYDGEAIIRWRAVTLTGKLARREPELVRPLVGRFIWWMNNESGGIGWGSAPALGEIGRMEPGLIEDSVRVVLHFRAERFLIPGVLWAAGRLERTYPQEVKEVVPDLVGFLGDDDGNVRGQAAWALGEIGDRRALEELQGLTDDPYPLWVYEKEELAQKETGIVAAEALRKISAR